MKRASIAVLSLLVMLGGCRAEEEAAAVPAMPAAGPLEGAWRVTQFLDESTGVNTSPQPGLYIFAPGHYSVARVNGTEPRPLWPDSITSRAALTAQQVRATFEPYTSNSGTYSLHGDTLIVTPMVALSPNFMNGGADTTTYRMSGDTLVLTGASGALTGGSTTLIRLR